MRYLAIALLILCTFACASFGQSTTHLIAQELQKVRLPDVVLEKFTSVKADSKKNPVAYVQVEGLIGGNIRFELLLPEGWNGRFVMGGGGGFVGSVQNSARDCVNQHYATVGTDTGHEFPSVYLAPWARDNVEAQLDFGYLAVHRTAEVSKALIRAYYHADPAYSYFVGCSRGGGQAMMETQRYPNDFDGVVAGAPAFNWTGFAATSVAIAKALYPDPAHLDHTVLDRAALVKLRQSILDQCDAQDGLKDGIIADPPSAHFDLSKVSGLTDEQRRAIEVVYGGARDGQTRIYPGYSPGAECDPDNWLAWIVGPIPSMVAKDRAPDLMFAFGTQIFKYFVFDRPDWDYSTYDMAHYATDTRVAASFLNATNPDLDQFKVHKGKLIIWHGWADTALPAQATVDYYQQVRAHDKDAADYCRLFMIPGCLHCGGGPGASEVDWLSVIVDWVEHQKAPDRVIASKHENGKLAMTRPLYPYPQVATYKGSGDSKSAESFRARSGREPGH